MKKLLKRLCSAMVAAVMVMTMAPAAFAADSGAQFQNGPYLLAPKTNSMVVVWESTEKVSATIAYGTDESKLCDPIKVEIDADAPDFKGSKMNLFHYKLDNLCAVVDRNRLQISGNTEDVMKQDSQEERWAAFGWNVLSVPGNDMDALVHAFELAKHCKGKPTVIIANTTKGCGSSVMENKAEWHHKVPTPEEVEQIMKDLDERKEALS